MRSRSSWMPGANSILRPSASSSFRRRASDGFRRLPESASSHLLARIIAGTQQIPRSYIGQRLGIRAEQRRELDCTRGAIIGALGNREISGRNTVLHPVRQRLCQLAIGRALDEALRTRATAAVLTPGAM